MHFKYFQRKTNTSKIPKAIQNRSVQPENTLHTGLHIQNVQYVQEEIVYQLQIFYRQVFSYKANRVKYTCIKVQHKYK